jgi:hypothetical protein
MTNLSTDESFEISPPSDMPVTGLDLEFCELVNKLCMMIQEKTGCYLALKEWSVSEESAKITNGLITLFETGKITIQNTTMFPTFKKDMLEMALVAQRTNKSIIHKTEGASTTVRLLEVDIPLGLASWQITGIPEMTIDELEQTFASMEDEANIEIPFFVIDGVCEFNNWMPTIGGNS